MISTYFRTATCFRTAKLSATSSRHGDDLRRDPLEGRKATLEMILGKAGSGIRFNEHMDGDGDTVFRHACKLGLEGIVSKRKGSPYRSGRSPYWLKMKNAAAYEAFVLDVRRGTSGVPIGFSQADPSGLRGRVRLAEAHLLLGFGR
jgi:hypothetical protein